MDLIHEIQSGNRVFRIIFPDGLRVPFKLLSWKQFQDFQLMASKASIPKDILEDAIFRTCVLDQELLKDYLDVRAGVITTLVNVVMTLSGSTTIENFNESLDYARQIAENIDSQIVMIICRAFPGYTPEDIQKMYWKDILVRLAQAEKLLMTKNPPELAEPLRLLSATEQNKSTKSIPSGKVDVDALVKDGQQIEREFGSSRTEHSQGLSAREMQDALRIKNARQRGRK